MFSAFSSLSITGVVLAVIANMILGGIWYTPAVFGNRWMKLVGLHPDKMKSGAGLAMASAVINSIALSVTLGVLMQLVGVVSPADAAVFALWMWAAFSFVPLWMHILFDHRPKGILWINGLNELVSYFLIVGILHWFL